MARGSAETGRPPVVDGDLLRACVHCGLCLTACPTYVELGTEMDSPRGRIHLMRALEDGTLPLDSDVVRHLDLCLGCRACETACPSGVEYGRLIEEARAYVQGAYRRPFWEEWRWRVIAAVFPNPRALRGLLAPVRLLQRLGLWKLLGRVLPAARLLPTLSPAPPLAEIHPARGTERARVGLLAGCVAREIFPATNAATVRVLNQNGVTVVVPPDQVCCGALHLHGGEPETARRLARRNLGAFAPDLDAVIVNAAGCGATMKRYGGLFEPSDPDAPRAAELAGRVRDVSEFLADLGIEPPPRAFPWRVTYHDACHLVHGQGVRDAPRALLSQIPGIEVVDLDEADLCCGSAGSYNLTEPAMATRLRERKVDHIVATGATCVVAANPGCILQIQAGLRARGLDLRVAHPVDLLAEAYGE
jgi:glycolate oxidase iron-sulfur subunit